MRSCPNCGKPLTTITHNGITIDKCDFCNYSINQNTGKIQQLNRIAGNTCIVKCPSCHGKIRVAPTPDNPITKIGDVVECSFCNTTFQIPPKPDPDLFITFTCACQHKTQFPANRGKLPFMCPKCKQVSVYDSGEWPTSDVTQNTAQQTNSYSTPPRREQYRPNPPQQNYYSAQPQKEQYRPNPPQRNNYTAPPRRETQTNTFNRTITIKRLTHAYKEFNYTGARNLFMDTFPVHIFLDGKEQGNLSKNTEMVLSINQDSHQLKSAVLAPAYNIPAGTDNYIAFFFNDKFKIGPEIDVFRDKLTEFVLNIFRGQGIRDRINDPNNSDHVVRLSVDSTGIKLSWNVKKTRGLKQWATGEEEEIITYERIGLCPMSVNKMPGGYWPFVEAYIENAILCDKEADMMKTAGGFTFCDKHNLF